MPGVPCGDRENWDVCFCKESLGKIKLGAFPKRVGPRILSLESDDYFGTSEHY